MADDAPDDLDVIEVPVDRRALMADQANVRRIKALAATSPIDDLERNKDRYDGSFWGGYDLRAIALAVIEHIALSVDIAAGLSYDEAAEYASAQAARHQPARSSDQHDEVGLRVLRCLIAAGASPYRYLDVAATPPVWREFTVRLVYEQAAGATTHLRVSEEAINVLVDALDLDIADIQEAQEAQMSRYIARGMMSAAERVAADARLMSVRYLEQVQRIVYDTMADVDAHDWAGDVDRQLDAAMVHVTERQRVERALKNMVEEKRDGLADAEALRSATALLDALSGCLQRHAALHAFILGARTKFRVAQDNASRWQGVSEIRYDLDADVVRLLAAAPRSHASRFAHLDTGRLVAQLAAPEPFAWEHFATVFDSLFLPPNIDDSFVDDEPDFAGPPPPAWWQKVWDAANDVIDDITGPTWLADLLGRAGGAADDHGCDVQLTRAAVAHLAYNLIDPGVDDLVAVPLPALHSDEIVTGPDLLLVRVGRSGT